MTTPSRSAQSYVQELKAAGLSNRAIGRIVGRNDRYIGYIANGDKPGDQIRSALAAAADAVRAERSAGRPLDVAELAAATPQAERRKTKAGTQARVRRRASAAGGHYRTASVRAGGARNGARSLLPTLRYGAARGWRASITVRLRLTGIIEAGPAEYQPNHWTDFKPSERMMETATSGPASFYLGEATNHGGNVTAALLSILEDEQKIAYDPEYVPEEIVSEVLWIEIRTYDR